MAEKTTERTPETIYVSTTPAPISPEQAQRAVQQAEEIRRAQNDGPAGGAYIVNGQKVDANGEPVKS